MKSKLFSLLKLLITAVLLGYVLKKVGLFTATGREELFQLIASANIWLVLCSFGVSFFLNLSSGFKWYMLLFYRGVKVGFFRCYALYMIGIFFSLFLPTSMGGDLIRIHELGKYTGKQAEAAASVFVERFSGLVILFFLTIIAILWQQEIYSIPWVTISAVIATLISLVIIWVIIDDRPFRIVQNFFLRRFPILSGLFKKLAKFHSAILEYQHDKKGLVVAVLNSFLFYFLAIVNVWVTAMAFDIQVRFQDLILAVPLIMFIMNLPISIGGIGLMEFAFIFIFELSGYSSALGLSTALLMRFKSFLDAGIGGMLYPVVTGRKIGEVPQDLTTD